MLKETEFLIKDMVNKKLSQQDEELIYLDWLKGDSITAITRKYPVVISTVQRVIKKKNLQETNTNNYAISNIFKHLKNANNTIGMTLQILPQGNIHEKQQEMLLESLSELSSQIDILVSNIKQANI